jgi:hypothetical protein
MHVQYWITSYDGIMELKIIFDDGQIWTWKYPRCNYDLAVYEFLQVMPPFTDETYFGRLRLDNCSLEITYQGRLLFEYKDYTERHYRGNIMVMNKIKKNE